MSDASMVPVPARRWPSLALGALAVGICIVKYGVGVFPSWVYLFDIARNWTNPGAAPLMTPPADYLLTNFPAAWLAGAFGMSTPWLYFWFSLVLAVAALLLPFALSSIRRSVVGPRILLMFVVAGPTSLVLLGWVGGYDAITVIGLGIAALSRHRVLAASGWLLVALNHPPLGLFALVFWLPIMWVTSNHNVPKRLVTSGIAAVGVSLGWLANTWITSAWGGATSRLEWLHGVGWSEFISTYLSGLPYVVFGAMGAFWMVLLAPSFRVLTATRVLVVEAVVAALLLPLVSLDASRVVALTLYAATLCWIRAVAARPDPEPAMTSWRWYALGCIIIPAPLLWEGHLIYPGWGSVLHLNDTLTPPAGWTL